MELNARQKKVVFAKDSKILCLAGSGVGKTRVLTERIRNLILNEKVDPTKIVAITFSNMGAREMKMRLGDISGEMFVGTIHSYANKICNYNGISMMDAILAEDYDDLLITASKMKKFPPVEHLLIDEAQDIASLEFLFITKIPTENIFFVGDDRQNIYQFRGGSDKYIDMMNKDTNFQKYYLTENYRSAPNIIKFADELLGSYRSMGLPSKPIKETDGIIEEVSFLEALDMLEENRNWGSWFILTRTNDELEQVMDILQDKDIPFVTFKKADLESNDILEQIMNSNNVKVLTCHSAKGLERKNVIVVGAKTYNLNERKLAYVAATRAENALYWCPSLINRKVRKNKESRAGYRKDRIGEKSQLITF